MNAAASLFSNAKANASREDIAMGLIWMVLQCDRFCYHPLIARIGHQGFRAHRQPDPAAAMPEVFPAMEKLYGCEVQIPKYSEFCTAIGAALDYKRNQKKLDFCIKKPHI